MKTKLELWKKQVLAYSQLGDKDNMNKTRNYVIEKMRASNYQETSTYTYHFIFAVL